MFVGQKFDYLTILEILPDRKAKVVCDCGMIKTVSRTNLGRKTVSCGHIHRSKLREPRSHGKCKTRTYRIWSNMLTRCRNRNTPHTAKYYAGITCDVRWEKFENFLADMGECPPGLSLDRINNSGNYTVNNCRWATSSEQACNRRPRGSVQ